MSEVIPAILAENVSDLERKISQLPSEVKFVHIDVLEKDFWTEINIPFEAHLMVSQPEKTMERWIGRGAKRIIVHQLNDQMTKCRDQAEIGLAVELETSLEKIFPLISSVDFIHLMSIAEIGAQGHPLDERIFDRIEKVKEHFPQVMISVDGGINITNYQTLLDQGVTRLVVGSGFKDLWNSLTKK